VNPVEVNAGLLPETTDNEGPHGSSCGLHVSKSKATVSAVLIPQQSAAGSR
jgi:hypothetical protein